MVNKIANSPTQGQVLHSDKYRIKKMRLSIIALKIVFIFSLSDLSAQKVGSGLPDSIQHYIDTVFNILRTKSLFTREVNWLALADSVNRQIAPASTIQDLMPAIGFLFTELGDKHGGLNYKNRRYGLKSNWPLVRDELAEGFKLGAKVRTHVFENTFGYILIPPIWALSLEDATKYAMEIQDSVCMLSRGRDIKGWIIDLRMNMGGNMFSMLAGISNILGDGVLGSFITADNKRTNWSLRNGDAYEGEEKRAQLLNRCKTNDEPKVAVLISQITSSSGEMVAISFKGRNNTRFFGENTSGYTTANDDPYFIDKNSMLLVATARVEDRNGNLYKDVVKPDLLMVEGDNFKNLGNDKKVQAALTWLKTK